MFSKVDLLEPRLQLRDAQKFNAQDFSILYRLAHSYLMLWIVLLQSLGICKDTVLLSTL